MSKIDNDVFTEMILKEIVKNKPDLSEDEVVKEYNKFLETSLEPFSDKMVIAIRKDETKLYRKIYKFREKYNQRLYKRWKTPLSSLHLFIERCLTEGRNLNRILNDHAVDNEDYKFIALARMHGKAIQVCYEILALLENGLADGAYARWRTLFENTIFSFLIFQNDNNTAKRYLDYFFVSEYYKLLETTGDTNSKSYKSQLKNAEKKMAELETYHGDGFLSKNKGWLSHIFSSKDRSIKNLQKIVQMDHMNYFYKTSCANVHSGPDSLFTTLGYLENSETRNMIVAGPSNYGLSLPGQNTIINLNQITINFLLHNPTLDRIILSNALSKICNTILHEFDECQKKLEYDELKLRKKGTL